MRPGGSIGVVVPGLLQPLGEGIPAHLTRPQANGAVFWEDDACCFLTRDAWAEIWQASPRVALSLADTLPEGWRHWRDFEAALEASGKNVFPSVVETLDADAGRHIGFVRLVGERSGTSSGMNLYHPALKAIVTGGR